ncbi:MAG: hypothetical protein LQ344_000634 [Seirophora lacunosa]|nr:MAG: hypothetical protein LQ344_000634 [Seirophora lacunosa]
MSFRAPWLALAVASGACAAINGLFFTLNLAFNALMWALFTAALTRASSTTRVSVVNTSSNFLLTALLGLAIFAEKLPGLWWAGAALLVAGCVVIGARKEDGDVGAESGPGVGKGDAADAGVRLDEGVQGEEGERYRDEEEETVVDDDVLELDGEVGHGTQGVDEGR